jgi:hypothetical protein
VSRILEVSATGDVTTFSTRLRAVSLTAGSDAATLTLRAGGSGGTVFLVVKAAASTTAAVPDLHDALFSAGVHATLAGTAPSASIVFG